MAHIFVKTWQSVGLVHILSLGADLLERPCQFKAAWWDQADRAAPEVSPQVHGPLPAWGSLLTTCSDQQFRAMWRSPTAFVLLAVLSCRPAGASPGRAQPFGARVNTAQVSQGLTRGRSVLSLHGVSLLRCGVGGHGQPHGALLCPSQQDALSMQASTSAVLELLAAITRVSLQEDCHRCRVPGHLEALTTPSSPSAWWVWSYDVPAPLCLRGTGLRGSTYLQASPGQSWCACDGIGLTYTPADLPAFLVESSFPSPYSFLLETCSHKLLLHKSKSQVLILGKPT